MDREAALRRLIEQVKQMGQQHAVDLQSIRAKHETDLAALRAANETDLAALRTENERIRAQLPQRPSEQPPQPSNQHEEEGRSVSQPPTAPRAPTPRPATHRSHSPTNRSAHEVSNVPAQDPGHRTSIRRHPFVDGIMETPLPFGWKSLNIDRYDGTTDPDEHVDLYITQVNLTNEDAIMCRVFSTSLKGAVLNWYTQLPMESIDNFDTLVRQFTVQYATSRPHHVTSAALASLRQGDDESLRAFMEFFVSISVKIRNLNLEVALHAMLMALKPGPFVATLCRRSPLDMDGLRAQATGQFKKAARANKGGRYDFYTPLSAPRVHILEEASNNNLLTLPPPTHSPNNADRSKHCRYHRNHGHTTEEFRTLRDRGFAGGGSSSSARKRNLRSTHKAHSATSASHQSSPPITFTDDDYTSICPNQDDPMVIAVEVAKWEVHKTLIDQGSSADVLYWLTFLRRIMVCYLLVEANTSYNIIIRRTTLNQLGAVVSTPHLTMKFPGSGGKIICVRANQKSARQCYAESLKVGKCPRQCIKISRKLNPELRQQLEAEISKNIDLFAW
ncbi:uncharacterized protein LOC109810808 [Cajanus cajan]|uniref:uncharacterized protein LOC109810808 n=1 Tax=Cajanus cajan TaxID=3821 RepID=UPI00098D9DF7|nr:uncharacterized protein LOC109810808 [Cajanus cajan]